MHTVHVRISAAKFSNRKSRGYSQALQTSSSDYGRPMEELYRGEATVTDVANNAVSHLGAAGWIEITCALALPLLAVLLGIWLNRWIDNSPKKSLHNRFLDFAGPLWSPLFAVLLLMAAGYTMRGMEIDLHILPFVWKLAVAWLAIRLVALVSSRQSTGWLAVLVIAPITLMHLFGIWEPVTESLSNVKFTIGDAKVTAYGAIKSIGALIALFWIAGFIVRLTDTRLRRIRRIHVSNRALIMKFFQITLYFIVFLIGLQLMGVDLTAFSVLGGALGVGIGFGLQKIASNFISGIILLFEKSVSIDDLIELADGTSGFIRQTAARYTLLEGFDGREILIPNEEFISSRVTTLTHSTTRGRVDVSVGVAYGSDLEKVKKILLDVAANVDRAISDPAPSCYLTGFGESSIDFTLYFWVENVMEGRLGPKSDAILAIDKAFRKNGVSIPFPHQVQVADPGFELRFKEIEQKLASLTKTASDAPPKTKATAKKP